MAPPTPNRVHELRPTASQLIATVRRAAASSANVKFSYHALDRMEERGITTLDVLRVVRGGDIDGDIVPGSGRGEWKCKITKPMKGSREIGVLTIVLVSGQLFIKTVEWEDL